MKRLGLIFILVYSLILLIGKESMLFAHEPKWIDLGYNPENGMLDIEIDHRVLDPEAHYIERIDILVNGQNYKTYSLNKQEDKQRIYEFFRVEAYNGDEIKVKVYCSVIGSSEEIVRVSGGKYYRDDYRYQQRYYRYPSSYIIIPNIIHKRGKEQEKLDEIDKKIHEEHLKHHKEVHPDIPVDSQSEEHLKHHEEEHKFHDELHRLLHQNLTPH